MTGNGLHNNIPPALDGKSSFDLGTFFFFNFFRTEISRLADINRDHFPDFGARLYGDRILLYVFLSSRNFNEFFPSSKE